MASFLMFLALAALWFASTQIQIGAGRSAVIWRNPYTWFVGIWLVQFSLLTLPLMEYEFPTSASTLLYIFAAHIAFLIGMSVALWSVRPTRRIDTSQLPSRRTWMLILLSVSLVGEVAMIANGVFSGTVDFAARFTQEGYAEARRVQLYEDGFDTSFLGPLFGPLSAAAAVSFIALGYFGFYRGMRAKWTRLLNLETVLVIALAALVVFHTVVISAARSGIAYTLVSYAGPFLMGRSLARRLEGVKRVRWAYSKKAAVLAVLFGLFMASAWYQQFRAAGADPRRDMWLSAAAEPHPAIEGLVAESRYAGFVLVQIGYLTSSSNMLDHYLQLRHHPGPFYGRYNFPTIYRNFFRFLPGYNPNFWADDRADLFKPLEDRGRLGNVWTSLIRDFIADFGKAGALIAIALLGWATQRSSDAFYQKPDAFRASLLVFLLFICAASALHSMFFIANIAWAVLFLTLLVLTGLGTRRSRRAVNRRKW